MIKIRDYDISPQVQKAFTDTNLSIVSLNDDDNLAAYTILETSTFYSNKHQEGEKDQCK